MVKYVTSRVACEQLGLHANTLRKYADEGSI
ncbi:MAG TPA: IS607 family transposase, partial [Thiothrix sp.]|nr:IS607 family transposase [Thiothrix sp.]